MADNILLHAALARLDAEPSKVQLVDVCRQMLQGELILSVEGDAQAQISRDERLRLAVLREGEHRFLLAFSTAEAFEAMRARQPGSATSSMFVQPVTAVLAQLASGDFAGLALNSASAPHSAIVPTAAVTALLADADPALTVKSLLAGPRDAAIEAAVAEALTTTRMWVAAHKTPSGEVALAQVELPDEPGGLLQLFSHPWEVAALGRGDRALPFVPAQLAQTLNEQPMTRGVLIDPAGPSLVVSRAALSAVIALAE